MSILLFKNITIFYPWGNYIPPLEKLFSILYKPNNGKTTFQGDYFLRNYISILLLMFSDRIRCCLNFKNPSLVELHKTRFWRWSSEVVALRTSNLLLAFLRKASSNSLSSHTYLYFFFVIQVSIMYSPCNFSEDRPEQ